MDRAKKRTFQTFLKKNSKHHRVISSKFPKSFRGAGDLMVLGEFLKVSEIPEKLQKNP